MCNNNHRNIKVLGDSLIAFTFNLLIKKILSNLLGQLSPELSVVHVQCGEIMIPNSRVTIFHPLKRQTD